MVQVIAPPSGGPKTSFLQSLVGGFAEGIPQALSQYQQYQQSQRKKQLEAQALEKAGFGELLGLPENLQKVALQEGLRSKYKQKQIQGKQQFLEEILNRGKQPQEKREREEPDNLLAGAQGRQLGGLEEPSEQIQRPMETQLGFDPTQIPDEDIAAITAQDPNVGRSLQHAKDVGLREKREQERLKFEKEKHKGKLKTEHEKAVSSSFSENQTYIDDTYNKYEDSLRKDAILGRMGELEAEGQMSDSGLINTLEKFGIAPEFLKNPANEEYTKLTLDLLGGGTLQSDYGSRVLQSEFKVSMQRIPTLKNTPEGRKQIAENMKTMILPSILKKERLQFYLDQAERTGKPLPHNLRGKILKDIKPQLEEAYDTFKQRNGRYKVKEGTIPDDNALEKYYFLSDGNEIKAMKMMGEDGYDTSL